MALDAKARPRAKAALRAARYVLLPLAVLAVALGGVLLGMRAAGSNVYDTDLVSVRVEVFPHIPGEVNAYVPIADWGLRARAFDSPLQLRAEPLSVNRKTVLSAAGGNTKVLTRAEHQLSSAANSALLREAIFAIAGGLLAALLVVLALAAFGRRGRRLLGAVGAAVALTAIVVVVGSTLLTSATFNAEAFDHPRFYAHGAELLQLLDAASKANARGQRYRTRVQATLVGLSRLLADSNTGDKSFAAVKGSRRALLVSDLHANTLVLPSLEELAKPRRPIFFVGDFGHQGSEAETKLVAPRLARLGSRVVAVSGNHDSSSLMKRLASVGITVLAATGRLHGDGTISGSPIVSVMGMRVAGYPDPLEWHGSRPDDPKRVFSFPELKDGDRIRSEAENALVQWFDGLPERPDIVLVHQNTLAQHLAETLAARPLDTRPLLILTGHDHVQHVDRYRHVVVADAGTVGAGGPLGFAYNRVGLGDLHFVPGRPELGAVDLILADPFTGSAQAQRVVVADHTCPRGESSCQLSP